VKASLASIVSGVAVKRLVAVEALPSDSNQHEFNGVRALQELFGSDRARFETRFVYFGSDDQDVVRASGFVTWYDARENHPARSEYRLYFPTTAASERIREGDIAYILRLADGRVLIAFTADGSTAERQLAWLFDLETPDRGLSVKQVASIDVGFSAREILDELGIEPPPPLPDEESYLDVLLDRFGGGFPSTAEFSRFARGVTSDVSPLDDPDGTVIVWLEREEALFRQLERHLVLQRLRQGFKEDVDAFVAFSLSVQNRRKSRVGQALENHLEELFRITGIRNSRGQTTERTSRPDFMFPGIEAYRNPAFPAERLTMLGVKSTCKDRWRQVLPEADRVSTKHLFTLEPAISSAQTDEMTSRGVVLVMPAALHATFTRGQRERILTVGQFIDMVRERQLE
jgi:hypothetical protein